MDALIDALARALETAGLRLDSWALAWARVLPLVVVVPAFGARVLPAVGRAVLGLSLALVLVPAVQLNAAVSSEHWAFAMIAEVARGLPIALSTAALLWAASMAGGLFEELRETGQAAEVSVLEPGGTGFGALLGLFAAFGFLSLGGVHKALEALIAPAELRLWYLRAANELVMAIGVAVALAAPLLALVILFEVASALVSRAAHPAYIRSLFAPIRALLVLVVLGLSLDALWRWLLSIIV